MGVFGACQNLGGGIRNDFRGGNWGLQELFRYSFAISDIISYYS
jgi:hypothetical protein